MLKGSGAVKAQRQAGAGRLVPMFRAADGVGDRRTVLLSTGLAMLLACAVLLPLLGHKMLAEWDEGIYAEVSREMLSQGWLVPHWNGQVWLEKPPLMLWVTAVLFKVFGVSEFWARAGSAFSGVAMVGLLHGWLARRQGLATAWLCSVALLGTLGFEHVARMGEMDVLLSLGCVLALCGMAVVGEGRDEGWYSFWGGFAVALMTKGAASVVLPLTLIALAGLERWRGERFRRGFWLGMAGFAALILPWHLAMLARFGKDFVAEYLGLHVITRATSQMEGHHTRPWYYLGVLLVSAAPFVLLYPVALAAGFRRRELRVWAIFVLVVLGFFSVVQTRLPHYIAPAYPALAVLTAVWMADWLRLRVQGERSRRFWAGLALAATAVCVVAVLATAPGRQKLRTAKLDDGTVLPDSKESEALLKSVFAQQSRLQTAQAQQMSAPRGMRPEDIGGPLLYWREGRIMSIATSVFYARRPVQQIRLQPLPEGVCRDRYTQDPRPLTEAVTTEPQVILLETRQLAKLPDGLIYRRIKAGPTMEVGVIARVR